MAIDIREPDHWQALARRGLNVVVDPMVVRCGELFLKGAKETKDPPAVWDLLLRNVHAIGMFFDSIILEEKIPIFNYGETFDEKLNLGRRVLAAVNQNERILYEVNVEYGPYTAVKEAACTELEKLYAGPARIGQQAAKDIIFELAAAEYEWQPTLGPLEAKLSTEDEKKLARFFLGGLIFGAYAQLLGGQHVIQPKRARLFLAAALRPTAVRHRFEDELFAELKKRAHASVTDLPWRPTLFPYLLSLASTPEAMLTKALALRRSAEVREYRRWLAKAVDEWTNHGRVTEARHGVAAITKAIDRKIGAIPTAPKVDMKVTLADVVAIGGAALDGGVAAAAKIPGKIDLGPPLAALWGWGFALLPGQRYQKLLTRAIVSDREYRKIENRLASVWGWRV